MRIIQYIHIVQYNTIQYITSEMIIDCIKPCCDDRMNRKHDVLNSVTNPFHVDTDSDPRILLRIWLKAEKLATFFTLFFYQKYDALRLFISFLFRCTKQKTYISKKYNTLVIFCEFFMISAHYLLPGSESGRPKWNGSGFATSFFQKEGDDGKWCNIWCVGTPRKL